MPLRQNPPPKKGPSPRQKKIPSKPHRTKRVKPSRKPPGRSKAAPKVKAAAPEPEFKWLRNKSTGVFFHETPELLLRKEFVPVQGDLPRGAKLGN